MGNPTRYSVGFLFTPGLEDVLLVKKDHPEWQRGLWNGIGGHFEPGETPLQCMAREFREETGLTAVLDWKLVCQLNTNRNSVVYFGATTAPISTIYSVRVKNDVGELLGTHRIHNLIAAPQFNVSNLQWVIPMAMSFLQQRTPEDWPLEISEAGISE